jgi:hypothetical protein
MFSIAGRGESLPGTDTFPGAVAGPAVALPPGRGEDFPMHPAALPAAELLRQTRETHTRRSGPGGQHRNKTQTAVVLVHLPTGIDAEAAERRSQAENRRVALRRLRDRLALEHRLPATPGPSPRWAGRARGGRLVISVDHDDFPALVAEALDQLAAHAMRMAPTAERLGVTATQLANLFRKDAAAWTALNRRRAAVGAPPLD